MSLLSLLYFTVNLMMNKSIIFLLKKTNPKCLNHSVCSVVHMNTDVDMINILQTS